MAVRPAVRGAQQARTVGGGGVRPVLPAAACVSVRVHVCACPIRVCAACGHVVGVCRVGALTCVCVCVCMCVPHSVSCGRAHACEPIRPS